MCLADGFAAKDLRHEGAGEGIACADGVGYSDFGSRHKTLIRLGKNIRDDSPASEDEHLQVVFHDEIAANGACPVRIFSDEMPWF